MYYFWFINYRVCLVSNRAAIKLDTETPEATELESNKTADAETTKTRPPTVLQVLYNIFSVITEGIKEALPAKDVKPKEKKKEPKKSIETTVEKITDEVLTKDVNATDEES